jgi:hypothetical protein
MVSRQQRELKGEMLDDAQPCRPEAVALADNGFEPLAPSIAFFVFGNPTCALFKRTH